MSRFKTTLGLLAFLVISGIAIIKIFKPVIPLTPFNPDFIAIQTTLQTFADLDNLASYTFDDSRLSQVLANDPRGGLVDPELLKSVQYMSGNPDLKIEDIGFLDVNQAHWAFERKVKQVYDDAIAKGNVKDPTPTPLASSAIPNSNYRSNRDADQSGNYLFHTPDGRVIPEIQAMEKASGLQAMLPVPLPEKRTPTGFKIIFVSVEGDLAYAKVDWNYGLCDDILVKKNGGWYLIGHHIIKYHGGG
jgi:hypothetical protein